MIATDVTIMKKLYVSQDLMDGLWAAGQLRPIRHLRHPCCRVAVVDQFRYIAVAGLQPPVRRCDFDCKINVEAAYFSNKINFYKKICR